MNSDFGFIIHPVDLDLIAPAFVEKRVYSKRNEVLKKMFEWLPSFKCSHVTGVESPLGPSVEGDLIYVPYLPEQIMALPSSVVLQRVIQAGRIAKELGAKILGLGAYAAFVGRRGIQIQEALEMPVTTGSAYTVAAAIRAASWVSKEIFGDREITVAVIGATGSLGGAIAKILAPKVGRLVIVGRQRAKLRALQEELTGIAKNTEMRAYDTVDGCLRNANLVFVSTSSPDTIIDVRALMPGTVVCDISQPHNVEAEAAASRKDILVVDGGLIRPPGMDVRFRFHFGLPEGLAFACMAETMILALEKRFESYSLGANITAESVDQITAWGDKHGFTLEQPRSFGRTITPDQIDRVRDLAT